jgi:hypothetical protein
MRAEPDQPQGDDCRPKRQEIDRLTQLAEVAETARANVVNR